MAGKVLRLLLPVSIGALIALQWREVTRYFKIKMMDFGDGHPEVVPAEGEAAYASPGSDSSDRTGEFEPGSRGGPPVSASA